MDKGLKKEKVVLIAFWGTRGAGTKFSSYLISELDALDVDVFVSMSDRGELKKNLSEEDLLKHSYLKIGSKVNLLSPLRYFKAKKAFRELVVRINPDLIVFPMPHLWDLFLHSSYRIIRVIHDATPHPGDGLWPTKRALKKRIMSGDILVTLSKSVSNQVNNFGKVAHQFSHPEFYFGARLDVMRDSNEVLFIGRQRKYKGGDLLANAWGDVVARNPQVRLVVAGQGRIPRSLKRIENVEIHNHWLSEDEISLHLQRCHVAVFPYIEASQSGLIGAASSYGAKVVATPVGGLIEQTTEINGYLAGEVSANSLAETLNHALSGHINDEKTTNQLESDSKLIQFIVEMCE